MNMLDIGANVNFSRANALALPGINDI